MTNVVLKIFNVYSENLYKKGGVFSVLSFSYEFQIIIY